MRTFDANGKRYVANPAHPYSIRRALENITNGTEEKAA